MASRFPDAPARRLLDRYASTRAARLHTLIRWLSAPLREVEAWVPHRGRILEIGCGHGLFSALIALDGPDRQVVGTDIDAEKITTAKQATADIPNLSFHHADARELAPGTWDCIVILDVLYLLDESTQSSLVRHAAVMLAPGGRLLIKEMAERPRWKAQWNRLQETLSVRVLRITHGRKLLFVPTAQMVGWLREAGLAVEVVRLDRRRVHPHQLLVAVKAGSDE